jgi:uncharacterized protein with von Willebrand factor type A (vWA) domain
VNDHLVLEYIFTTLVREHNFSLGIRDYVDAIRALQAGFGLDRREDLLWLCQALWARSAEEMRIIQLLFEQIPRPTGDEVRAIHQGHDSWTDSSRGLDETAGRSRERRRATQEMHAPDEHITAPSMQFHQPGAEGFGLPRAQADLDETERFVMVSRPIIPLRSLIIAWRRFRRPVRSGPKTELDVDATIEKRCRVGVLEAPVLLARRSNMAQLAVLVDRSPSMKPWEQISSLLLDSLRESQLGSWTLFYFKNVPLDYTDDDSPKYLYADQGLAEPVEIDHVFRQNPGCAAMIISDAGAARRHSTWPRIRATEAFVKHLVHHWFPLVWINPVPRSRWASTSAEPISQLPQVSMFELTEDGLFDAVDVLRGTRTGR